MRHQAFTEEGPVEWEADYVVIGTGAGGAAAASQLARGGAEVVMVEAGPWRDPEDYPSSVYGSFRDLFDRWGSTVTRGRAIWPVIQGSCVGGSTVINSAIVVRTPGDIFEQWKTEHGVGGDALAQRIWAHQDRIEEELYVEPTHPDFLGRSSALALEAGQRLGIDSHVMRRAVKGCLGKTACLQGCRSRKKQSTNLQWVPEVLDSGGGLLSCAPVQKILFEGTRAVGVSGRFVHPRSRKKGARYNVRARRGVVVAASTTHTPCILQRSGVKSPALGAWFRAHPGCAIPGVYNDPVGMDFGATQGWATTEFRKNPGYKLESLNLPLELAAVRLKGGGSALMERIEELPRMGVWVAACRANSSGKVRNAFGRPMINYVMDSTDMAKLRAGLKKTAEMHFAMGATHVLPGIQGMPYKLMPDQLNLFDSTTLNPKAYTCILSHLFGGAVMGSDPQRSFCDGHGKAHNYEGLYIADAALMPTNLGVNPQHTIMAMARVVAEDLLERES
jgi:choline dehydrogenase-like flavoprotein